MVPFYHFSNKTQFLTTETHKKNYIKTTTHYKTQISYILIHLTVQTQMQTLGVGKSIMAAKTTPTLVTSWQIVIYWNVMCGKQACFYWFFLTKRTPLWCCKTMALEIPLESFHTGLFLYPFSIVYGRRGGGGQICNSKNLPPIFVELQLQLLSFYFT